MIKALRFLMVLLVIVLTSGQLFAQNAKLYLNDREIAQQSVHFLDASTIDSINFYTGAEANKKLNLLTTGVDSVFVVFKRDVSDIVSYYQLLDLFHLNKRARTLAVSRGSARQYYIDKPNLMVFNPKRVTSISIQMDNNGDYAHLDNMYNRPYYGPYKGPGSAKASKTLIWLQGYVEGYGDNFYYRKFKGK